MEMEIDEIETEVLVSGNVVNSEPTTYSEHQEWLRSESNCFSDCHCKECLELVKNQAVILYQMSRPKLFSKWPEINMPISCYRVGEIIWIPVDFLGSKIIQSSSHSYLWPALIIQRKIDQRFNCPFTYQVIYKVRCLPFNSEFNIQTDSEFDVKSSDIYPFLSLSIETQKSYLTEFISLKFEASAIALLLEKRKMLQEAIAQLKSRSISYSCNHPYQKLPSISQPSNNSHHEKNHFRSLSFGAEEIRIGDFVRLSPYNFFITDPLDMKLQDESKTLFLLQIESIYQIVEFEFVFITGQVYRRSTTEIVIIDKNNPKNMEIRNHIELLPWIKFTFSGNPLNIFHIDDIAGRFYPIKQKRTKIKSFDSSSYLFLDNPKVDWQISKVSKIRETVYRDYDVNFDDRDIISRTKQVIQNEKTNEDLINYKNKNGEDLEKIFLKHINQFKKENSFIDSDSTHIIDDLIGSLSSLNTDLGIQGSELPQIDSSLHNRMLYFNQTYLQSIHSFGTDNLDLEFAMIKSKLGRSPKDSYYSTLKEWIDDLETFSSHLPFNSFNHQISDIKTKIKSLREIGFFTS